MFFAYIICRWHQLISLWVWFSCYWMCFQQGACWYLQMAKSKQVILKYQKDTSYDIFRKKSSHHLDLRIDNQNIGVTQTSKFLGVYIDDKLNWKAHISYVAGKFARGIGVLGKARKYLHNDCMINLYNAFIFPYLMYCNHIRESTNLLKLQILQNKAVRIATGSLLRTNTENMYKCSGIMKLDYIDTYLVWKFMYKV